MSMLRNFNQALTSLFLCVFCFFFVAASTCALAFCYSSGFQESCIAFMQANLSLIKLIAWIQICLCFIYLALVYLQKRGAYIQLCSTKNVCVDMNVINHSITEFLQKEHSPVPFSLKVDNKQHIHLQFHQTLPKTHFVDNFTSLEKALKKHLFLHFGYTKPFYFMVKM